MTDPTDPHPDGLYATSHDPSWWPGKPDPCRPRSLTVATSKHLTAVNATGRPVQPAPSKRTTEWLDRYGTW